jgi:prolyl 4-hydroxylase
LGLLTPPLMQYHVEATQQHHQPASGGGAPTMNEVSEEEAAMLAAALEEQENEENEEAWEDAETFVKEDEKEEEIIEDEDEEGNPEVVKINQEFSVATRGETEKNTPNYVPCNEEHLEDYWHDSPVEGLHIVCFNKNGEIVFFKNTIDDDPAVADMIDRSWNVVASAFVDQLGVDVEVPQGHLPWAVFSTNGQRLVTLGDTEKTSGEIYTRLAENYGMVLVYNGGQFHWPGTRKGFERKVQLYDIMPASSPDFSDRKRTVTLKTLSLVPLVFSVDGFLSDEECDYIQEKAEPLMVISKAIDMDGSDVRKSELASFGSSGDRTLLDLDYRLASLARAPKTHQEPMAVSRYRPNDYFQSHYDYYLPEKFQEDPNILMLIKGGPRNRMATAYYYLTSVEKGGETNFFSMNGKQAGECAGGLKIKPKKGQAILFYSQLATGKFDPHSGHASCPVATGLKWEATKFIWNEPMKFVPE